MARFTNQAQLRYGNEITNSNIAVGEITEVLSATKTAVRDTYGQNENVTYVISIVNSGTTAFNGITVTDNLGEYLFNTRELTPLTYIAGTVKYYANGILQATPAVTAGPPLTITGITVPAGGNVTLTYEAEVNSYAPLAAEASITNTATIAGAGVTPVTVNETVNAASGPLLTITKSVSPVPVTENGTLTYTFLIQNLGNTAADAATGVVITDTFNPVLENLTVNFNGTAWAEGTNYTYDTTTGLFTGTAGGITVPAATPAVTAGPPLTITGITVPAGGNVTLTYEAEVNSYAPLAAEASITNTATIAGAGVTPVTVNETVNAASGPLLTITKSVSPVPVTENGTLTYTFLIQNLGNTAADAATGVVITDTFNPVLENLTVNFNGTAWAEGTNYTYDTTTGLFTGTAGGITVPAATYTQDPVTGAWGINPGVSTLVISGTV